MWHRLPARLQGQRICEKLRDARSPEGAWIVALEGHHFEEEDQTKNRKTPTSKKEEKESASCSLILDVAVLLRLLPFDFVMGDGTEALDQRRMRVVEGAVPRVGVQVRHVLEAQLQQATLQPVRMPTTRREAISFELLAPGLQGVDVAKCRQNRGPDGSDEKVQAHNQVLVGESKGPVYLRIVAHQRKAVQRRQGEGLDDHEVLDDVAMLPMPKLVAENRDQLRVRHLSQQGVEKDDSLVLKKPEEERVGVGGSLRSIHDKDLRHGKLDFRLRRHLLDLGFQGPVLQRREGVKQRHDQRRRYDGQGKHDRRAKHPHVDEEEIASSLDVRPACNAQEPRENGRPQRQLQSEALDNIHHERGHRGLVEPMPRFHGERAVGVPRHFRQRLDDAAYLSEGHGVKDRPATRLHAKHQQEALRLVPDEGREAGEEQRRVQHPRPEAVADIVLHRVGIVPEGLRLGGLQLLEDALRFLLLVLLCRLRCRPAAFTRSGGHVFHRHGRRTRGSWQRLQQRAEQRLLQRLLLAVRHLQLPRGDLAAQLVVPKSVHKVLDFSLASEATTVILLPRGTCWSAAVVFGSA
mmetsp:Transcript_16445/g.62464  ORF Transcript_16445/g.62464 Transcript_16445/m.62464 type:complete len:577 (+) Transcript_16445:549-2279(+)